MQKFDNLFSFNSTQALMLTIKSALDIPSFQQIFLLFGVFTFLVPALIFSFIINNLSSPLIIKIFNHLIPQGQSTVGIFNQLIDYSNQFFYWMGPSSGCIEAQVCSAGHSMRLDFPRISGKINTVVDVIMSTTSNNQLDRYTRLLLDAMVGQGECMTKTSFDCEALPSSEFIIDDTHHGTEIAQVLAHSIYLKTFADFTWITGHITEFTLMVSAFFTGILTIIIGGLLFLIVQRKQDSYNDRQKVS